MTRHHTSSPRKPVAALTCAAALAALALSACGGQGSKPAAAGAPATEQSAPPSSAPSSSAGSAPSGSAGALERVVPEPAQMAADSGNFVLDQNATIGADSGAQDVANDLAGYLKQQVGPAPSVGAAGSIQLTLHPAGADAKLGTEGYQLDVDPASVHVTADSAAGLFHGVQTIRQLIVPGAQASIPAGHITDYPRFAYRGAMLDVARHFFSVDDVEKYIDALSLYKINELHLHLTDDQGWRFVVPSWPKLASHGGQTEVGGGAGGYYTAQDYQTIVAYAASRYMDVIPEIDMPGHVGAAAASYSQLACDGRTHQPVTSLSPTFDSLCTSKSSTYTFVDNVLSTIAAQTPGPYVHVGGDEASALTQQQYNGFIAQSQKDVTTLGKTPIAWAEIASGPIAPGTIAEFWNTAGHQPYIATAASHGTKLILAPGTHAYLDQQPVPGFPLGLHWAGYTPVSKAYAWDPATLLRGVTENQVLGVEATLFTETVHSLADAETLAFPRLPAVAEIGWSPQRSHNWDGFAARLAQQDALWAKLGVTYYESPEINWR